MALSVPAEAVPVSGAMAKNFIPQPALGEDSLVIRVQHRRYPYRAPRHHNRGRDDGTVAAGIIGGLLLGAIIANQAQQRHSVEYCVRRFRSYDPRSGTYVGYDGYRHRCP